MAHKPISYRIIAAVTSCLLILCACSAPGRQPSRDSEADYFSRWQGLCGAKFEGLTTFPEQPGEEFRGKRLVANVKSCSATEIRIPFAVGDDHSRTWVLSKTDQGQLLLKHDHRHQDGTPDEITNYGGFAAVGNALSQSFPADGYTSQLIPEAATNVWQISLSQDNSQLTYYLERHGEPRFRAEFTRSR